MQSPRGNIGTAEGSAREPLVKRNLAAAEASLQLYAGLAALKADQVMPVNRTLLERY